LGSAGGPARALPLLAADRFLIVNGDTLADVNLAALAAQHIDTNALVTMAVVAADPRYNAILADESGIVSGFGKSTPGPPTLTAERAGFGAVAPERPLAAKADTLGACHFVGVQAANAAAFAGVSPDTRSETVHGMYPELIAQQPGRLRVMRTTAEFFDIGTPRDYLTTALTLAAREGRPPDRGHGCTIAPGALLSDTILWNDVSVGAGASLTRCVVADGVRVAAGAKHVDCSLVMRDNQVVTEPFRN
jgi:mannose-1-phosphate guanylyltransferase